jgi:hypothetical protein
MVPVGRFLANMYYEMLSDESHAVILYCMIHQHPHTGALTGERPARPRARACSIQVFWKLALDPVSTLGLTLVEEHSIAELGQLLDEKSGVLSKSYSVHLSRARREANRLWHVTER